MSDFTQETGLVNVSELQPFAGSYFSAWQPSPGEEGASDFTYYDKDKTLLNWLLAKNIPIADIWQEKPLKSHIEVKSTTKSYDEVFHLSRLQRIKAESMTAPFRRQHARGYLPDLPPL